MPRAIVIGDSFVRRLATSVRRNPAGLQLRHWHVEFHGVPGGNVTRLSAWARQQRPRRYDVVYIHLGSNDLCSSDNPSYLVEAILDLARYLLDCWSVRQVVVAEVLPRWSNTRYRMPFTLAQYNSTVTRVNDMLHERCRQLDGVTSWRYGRCRNSTLYSDDGVHLNARGERRMATNVRGALLSCQQR